MCRAISRWKAIATLCTESALDRVGPIPRTLILGSTSSYRRALLARLAIPFEIQPSAVDETPVSGEVPRERAVRLAQAKARAVAQSGVVAGRAGCVVIGSDQVASCEGLLLRKPHTLENAREQLLGSSGRSVEFHTAACLIDVDSGTEHALLDHTVVRFRVLNAAEVERYLALEMPLDCAGSFKCEGAGISLFEAILSRDPTALIGLPLIEVSAVLRAMGWAIP